MKENFQKLKSEAIENEEKNMKNELEELKQKEKLWEEQREGMKKRRGLRICSMNCSTIMLQTKTS
jgi:hypothetical protein